MNVSCKLTRQPTLIIIRPDYIQTDNTAYSNKKLRKLHSNPPNYLLPSQKPARGRFNPHKLSSLKSVKLPALTSNLLIMN